MKKIILPLIVLSGLISCSETAVIKTSTIYNLDDKIVSVRLVEYPYSYNPINLPFSEKQIVVVNTDSLCNCSVFVKMTHETFKKDFSSKQEAVDFVNSFKLKNVVLIHKKEEVQITNEFSAKNYWFK